MNILVVDDEKLIRWSLGERLREDGYGVLFAGAAEEALEILSEQTVDLVLLDYRLPGIDGLEMLQRLRQSDAELPVIMITAHADIRKAVEATKLGAFDYLSKPFETDEISVVVAKALETTRLKKGVSRLLLEHEQQYGFSQIVAESETIRETIALARKIAGIEARLVLIEGETGTGKDLLARAIHQASSRAEAAFVAIPCANIPANLLESELFGHEKGAFTDAKSHKKGLLEEAAGGTVYLDEITDVELPLQGKLLKFLEDKSFRRLGGIRELSVDVRVIVSTNVILEKAVSAGTFRQDLYYRLKSFRLFLPPLRERTGDILPLCRFFITRCNREYHRRIGSISPEAERLLESYSWPGNIRELRNVIERGVMLQGEGALLPDSLPPEITAKDAQRGGNLGEMRIPPEGVSLQKIERGYIRKALKAAGGNQSEAARLLGISRDALRYRLKRINQEQER